MRVYGIGRLTKDIELKSSQSGTTFLASNSIACDRKFSKEKTTDFFNIKAFGKTAEAMERYLHKGSKIFIEGDLQIEEYTDKSGVKKQSPSITITSWEFAEGKGETETPKNDMSFLQVDDIADLPFS